MKIREAHILQALAKRHEQKDTFFTHVKNGPTQVAEKGELAIIDGMAISKSWAHPLIRGYEVKVDRGDFLRDTKWHKYFDMCHELSFACPTGLIQPDEVPEEAGLIYYNPEKQSLITKKRAVHRSIELSPNMLWYIIMSKLDSDRHPFFSTQREYFEAWVQDKEDRRTLGGWKVSEKLQRISQKISELERQIEREKKLRVDYEQIVTRANSILNLYGIKVSLYGSWEHELTRALKAGGAPNLQRVLQMARSLEKELADMHERTAQSAVLERSV